ncbi:DUF4192 domain-containing protein, partial [Actinoplanes sp. TFC3]|uniref:DUF4192 domain-containing protein n=1 Tax=Actinoplanes sp. TFC3 TaxID=1710355 RepID=UPI000829FB83
MTNLKVCSIPDLLSLVPYLLGFHPDDSLVVAGMDGDSIKFVVRIDLPQPGTPDYNRQMSALHLAVWVSRAEPDEVSIIGYGQGALVTPAIARLAVGLDRAEVRVVEKVQVADGRFWSYLCSNLTCCPPEGRPCPPLNSVIAAGAILAGAVALPSRKDVEARLASVSGRERQAMNEAGQRALSRLSALRMEAARSWPGGPQRRRSAPHFEESRRFERLTAKAGRVAVQEAERTYRTNNRLSDDELAWLVLLLQHLPVRDYAWTRPGAEGWQVALWSDVVRRADPVQVAPPASLLSFVAWRANEGAVATIAVDRALRADPSYRMAQTMQDILCSAVSPAEVEGWPVVPDRRGGCPDEMARGVHSTSVMGVG